MTMTIETETTAGITRKRPQGRTVTPSRALTWRKTASGHALYLRDRGQPLATVEPEAQHVGMWRVRMPDGWVSDMANLARAKDAAIRSVLFVFNRKETATDRPPVAQTAEGAAGMTVRNADEMGLKNGLAGGIDHGL
jgi:hypothetical protein